MKTKSMILAAVPLLLAITATAVSAQTSTPAPGGLDPYNAIAESVLWSFAGLPDDGANPTASLIADKSGNLYSTTQFGGANGDGTVFELSPPYGKSSTWSERVLYSFGATSDDGQNPGIQAALIADKWGNLYGTTAHGGADGFGTVFELNPPSGKSKAWSERVLYSFAGSPDDGAGPQAALLADQRGNFYGTTAGGGTNSCQFSTPGCGTVFELSPPYGTSTQWSEQVLYSFGATSDDGAGSSATLIADQRGDLYGTTEGGGADGFGTVFELNPPSGKSKSWSEQVLHSFGATSDDGASPIAGLLADKEGNLYGTTIAGFKFPGTVFEVSPPYGKSGVWSERVLWQFNPASGDGAEPQAGLIADQLGNLYGTTTSGGTVGFGTVFELSPPYGKSTQWSEQLLWSFAGSPDDGADPFAALLADQRGNFYGTTVAGGGGSCPGNPSGCGTVFELSLP
jgi:uncharacterized repeat protein (TIGR03803 family)